MGTTSDDKDERELTRFLGFVVEGCDPRRYKYKTLVSLTVEDDLVRVEGSRYGPRVTH